MGRYAYLVCYAEGGTGENHNKFYEIKERDDGTLDVRYGPVGGHVTSITYNRWEKDFNVLKASKLRPRKSGRYVDETLNHVEESSAEKFKDEEYPDIDGLAKELYEARRRLLSEQYLSPTTVNGNMIYSAREIISRLRECADRNAEWRFKDELTGGGYKSGLYTTIPRKNPMRMQGITLTQQKMYEIIDKEVALLDNLEADYKARESLKQNSKQSIFESRKVKVRPCTYKEEDELKELMNRSADMSECMVEAYRIENDETTAAFRHCKNEMKIPDSGCRLLFHGSGKENWLSIIEKGLLLDPEARITAKGLGHGLYFADDIVKSLNYTRDERRFIGVYEVATGKEWDTNGEYIGHTYHRGASFSFKDLPRGCQSVFLDGKKINSKHLNEYCVYKQEQANIKYLICCERVRQKDVRFSMHLHLPFENLVRDGGILSADAVLSDYAKDRLGKAFGVEVKTASAKYLDMFGRQEFCFSINGSPQHLTKDEEERLFRDFKKSFFESERDFNGYMERESERAEPDEEMER